MQSGSSLSNFLEKRIIFQIQTDHEPILLWIPDLSQNLLKTYIGDVHPGVFFTSPFAYSWPPQDGKVKLFNPHRQARVTRL